MFTKKPNKTTIELSLMLNDAAFSAFFTKEEFSSLMSQPKKLATLTDDSERITLITGKIVRQFAIKIASDKYVIEHSKLIFYPDRDALEEKIVKQIIELINIPTIKSWHWVLSSDLSVLTFHPAASYSEFKGIRYTKYPSSNDVTMIQACANTLKKYGFKSLYRDKAINKIFEHHLLRISTSEVYNYFVLQLDVQASQITSAKKAEEKFTLSNKSVFPQAMLDSLRDLTLPGASFGFSK